MRRLFVLSFVILLSGCATYGDPVNEPLTDNKPASSRYSYASSVERYNSGDAMVVVSISGGGTRASAFSYGVMKALKEQPLVKKGQTVSVLEEVDKISSVSGGSFTAAYYGLYGDRLFSDFEQDFLYDDVSNSLFWRLMNPGLWFSTSGITQEAVAYYERELFKGATFSDIDQNNRPLIVINASDLGGGVRFSFIQEYFDLLCSDISSYPISQAVAASSSVPVLFNPIVLENHQGCRNNNMLQFTDPDKLNMVTASTVKGLQKYSDKSNNQYIHLVDGGITDNLGLLSLYDMMAIRGGQVSFFNQINARVMPFVVFISIDASTDSVTRIGQSTKEPSIADTLKHMSSIQIHRYNDITKNLMKESLNNKSAYTLSDGEPVKAYFIDINLQNVEDKDLKYYLNNIPTDLNLEAEQVESLIAEGRSQTLNHPEFKRFINEMEAW
ncbi:patatin-like phospholipase family protein [Vibrio maerlii]|uniref:patatin-like phospholipase family protein n=1 Tax=Vibrio maerlii TaxID=2231648 RepID=UPI0013E016F4|nr:patatin-like phospholipase family protein [Vibrio maerlii]